MGRTTLELSGQQTGRRYSMILEKRIMPDKRTQHQRRQRELQREQELKRENQRRTIDMLIEGNDNADNEKEE